MSSKVEKWIGSDESGKGDYFGPLVIASVLVDISIARLLEESGVKDSKRLSDRSIKRLAADIKRHCLYSIVGIGPEKYNELYGKIGNLNRLLAWGHSRAIENILNQEECEYALADQFGDEKLIINALMEKGKTINVQQRVEAESDIGVAAASIIARAEFVSRLETLSARYGIKLPKGASQAVIQAGKDFVKKYGEDELKQVAKIHFKTTRAVLRD